MSWLHCVLYPLTAPKYASTVFSTTDNIQINVRSTIRKKKNGTRHPDAGMAVRCRRLCLDMQAGLSSLEAIDTHAAGGQEDVNFSFNPRSSTRKPNGVLSAGRFKRLDAYGCKGLRYMEEIAATFMPHVEATHFACTSPDWKDKVVPPQEQRLATRPVVDPSSPRT